MNKKKRWGKLVWGYVFLCSLILGTIFIFSNYKYRDINGMVYLTFFINTIVIIINLVRRDELGYSLDGIVWLFMLIFMSFAPLIQYFNNSFPWEGGNCFSDIILIKTNLIILFFILVYSIARKIIKSKIEKFKVRKKVLIINNEKIILNFGFYISIILTLYIVYKTGFTNLFSRSTNNIEIGNSSILLVIDNTFRAFPLIVFSMMYIYKFINGKSYNKWKVIILLFFSVLINFPTGLPRFQMAAIYIGLMIILKRNFNNKYFFKILIIFGILIIFPLINVFRYNTINDIVNLNMSLPNPVEDFLKGDFDSYSMIVRCINYINLNGSTLGYQLLGNIFFFIPRTFWNLKPVGSGVFIATNLGWNFKNVSFPYIAEGIINFGILGLILFAIVLAYFNTILDLRYKFSIGNKSGKLEIIQVFYPYIIGFIFFIMRGDLLSSLSFTFAFCFPIIILISLDKLISLFN
ncbi:O-antigen polymerase [Clostridium perfringens]|uniref:O-antigen polymerase n=1 Tax=Clostridium perfringens TaxID=1502 RepID=UPI001A22788A|nr:O-antigen polymerase [Clostridium perfringens]ELC8465868.1 oligosaccharide repeat unit polymerase [Clostridium perfringens]ELC8467316.1 oligosaccharide repeat unit polymerase [Clostridium perfringens]MBP2860495.1 oligosaccharide repeat unit polymerase [Clostridium perfringens]HAT4276913.1 oligosaccharide repeat unit polymerase [Clostridium perfringens]